MIIEQLILYQQLMDQRYLKTFTWEDSFRESNIQLLFEIEEVLWLLTLKHNY